jgi:hypothetical protein
MCDLICGQCRLPNTIDCQEPECPGQDGFVPRTWQRPLIQMTEDLERYESLILSALEKPVEEMLMMLVSEALEIRAKQKKEGRP